MTDYTSDRHNMLHILHHQYYWEKFNEKQKPKHGLASF